MFENRPPIRYPGKKRFVIAYGVMRSATRWVHRMMNLNVTGVTEFSHEGWHPNRFDEIDRAWRTHKPGIYGSVGMAGEEYWDYLMETYKPKVAFLWREPYSHALSMLCHRTRNVRPVPFVSGFNGAYAKAESLLHDMKRRGWPVTHFAMEHYTTEAGFRELCAALDLPLKQPLDLAGKFNSTRQQDRRPIGEYKDFVDRTMKLYPLCCAARRQALEA